MNLKNLFCLLLAIGTFSMATAQDVNINELLDNYFQAVGGKDKIATLESSRMEGKMYMQGMEFPGSITSAKPNLQRVDVDVQGKKIVQAYDGTTAWMVNPFMGSDAPQKMPAEMAEDMVRQEFEDSFLNYEEKGYKVELMGTEEVEGTSVYKVKLTKSADEEEFYYFDSEYFVPIMIQTMIMAGPTKGQFAETYLSDYQEVDGLMFPFSMEVKQNGQTIQKIVFTSVEINPELDEDIFAFPVEETAPDKN